MSCLNTIQDKLEKQELKRNANMLRRQLRSKTTIKSNVLDLQKSRLRNHWFRLGHLEPADPLDHVSAGYCVAERRVLLWVMRTISLKLPDDLLAQLDQQAKARRVTKSWLIREGLVSVLREQESARTPSCYDAAVDLAGSVKGLPEDLADDPKYMNGFGQ